MRRYSPQRTRSKRSFKKFLLCFLLFPLIAYSEPQIRQFYPDRPVLLGQPVFWVVELRHPMWESYDLRFGSCPDLSISIADKLLSEVAGEIRILYRVAIVPTAFKPSCTPTLTISDQKGQTTVLNGKPLLVRTISGTSEEMKPAPLPVFRASAQPRLVLYLLLVALLILASLWIARRIYSNTPTQKFIRDLRKASTEVAKNRLPIQIWRLLRSQILWGFVAEAYTPAQLGQKATADSRLSVIATALQSLEAWRYSGWMTDWDRKLVGQALEEAEDLIRSRSFIRRRRAA